MADTHAETVAFVRETSIPPSPPPMAASGPVLWMRNNLFATWGNSILTVVALYFVFVLLSSTLPWILSGIWNADSLAGCREALDGTKGACFAVLTERWNQLLFGFNYPSDAYGRPALAFVLLFSLHSSRVLLLTKFDTTIPRFQQLHLDLAQVFCA